MAAKAKIRGVIAIADGYEWQCDDEALKMLLDTLIDPLGPSGADPNPDYTLAKQAVEKFGGELLEYDETEYVEGRIY